MTLEKYEERLKLHNWNYQNLPPSQRWTENHVEYKKLIQTSFDSPDHRKLFLRYKKQAGIK